MTLVPMALLTTWLGCVVADNPNLKFMMFYDFNITEQHDIITTVSGDGASLQDMVRIYQSLAVCVSICLI